MLRDAWASLYRWHVTGEMIRTIDDAAPEIPDYLELTTAPVRSADVAYQLGDEQLIVVARVTPQRGRYKSTATSLKPSLSR
jgi:hypothetical protein